MSSDPAVIERYAAGLEQKAGSRVTRFTGLGTLIGAALGSTPLIAPLVSHVHSWVPHRFAYAAVVMGLAAGAYLGYLVGQSRAVALRLQASVAMHQVEMGRLLYRVEAMRLPLPAAASLPTPAPAPTNVPQLAAVAPPTPAPVVSLPVPVPPAVPLPVASVLPAAPVEVPAPAPPPIAFPQQPQHAPVSPPAPASAPTSAPAFAPQLTAVPPTFEWPPTTNAAGS